MPVMVPEQTVEQLGRQTLMAIGASDLTFSAWNQTLHMRVRLHRNQRHRLYIKLNGSDLYDVRLMLLRGDKATVKLAAKDVFCTHLSETVYRMCSPVGATKEWLAEYGIKSVTGISYPRVEHGVR